MSRGYASGGLLRQLEYIGRRDYLYFLFIVASLVGGTYLLIENRATVLGYDVLTLLMVLVMFAFVASPYIRRPYKVGARVKGEYYTLLILVPVVLRFFLYAFVISWSADVSAVVLNIVVGTSEETYRGGVLNIMVIMRKISRGRFPNVPLPVAIVVANLIWLFPHFLGRAFDLVYLVWLFVTGLCLGVVLVKSGCGNAVLGHVVINFTA